MNSQELRNLQEAYLEVVEGQQLDENRAAMGRINKEYHRKKEAEAMAARARDPKVKRDLPKRKNDNPMYDPKSAGSSRVKGFKFTGEEVSVYDIILSHLLDEGYAETPEAAESIMVNMSEEWRDSIVKEFLDEAEKPFPHEKVKAKQVALRDKGGNALDRRMKMGMAVRRAKEAEKTGGSQQDAGKGWYHGR